MIVLVILYVTNTEKWAVIEEEEDLYPFININCSVHTLVKVWPTPWTKYVQCLGQSMYNAFDKVCPMPSTSMSNALDKVCLMPSTKYVECLRQSMSIVFDKVCPLPWTKYVQRLGQSLSWPSVHEII